MFSLLQSKRVRGSAGEPLPTVFKTLAAKGTHFLRGQLVLVAAGPGTGKSAFMLTKALRSKVPSLIFSADSDAFTQLTRAIAITTGCSQEVASRAVLSNTIGDTETAALRGIPIRFNYDASPTLGTIQTTVDAYEEVYGEYPALIVVDNVTNVVTDSTDGDPFSGLEGLMDWLHDMARKTSACVVGLHHVTGPFNDSDKPVSMSGIKGQIGRVPEMVLTLFRPGPNALGVSTVKNRGGKADPSGNDYAELEFYGDTMQISDPKYSAVPDLTSDTDTEDEDEERRMRELW